MNIAFFYNKAARSGGLAILDQGLVSFTNFFITILLAREISQTEYGIFIVLQTIYIFASAINSSLIISPMTTIGPSILPKDTELYFSSITLLQFYFVLITFFILGFVGITALYTIGHQNISKMFLAMDSALIFHLLQDHFRKILFTRLDIKRALQNDMLSYGLIILGIIILSKFKLLSGTNTFIVVGFGSMIGSLFGFCQCKHLFRLKALSLKETANSHWKFGRWLLANVVSQQCSSQIYIYISAIFLSSQMVGALGAARNILGMSHIVIFGMDNLVNPIASKSYNERGIKALNSILKKTLFYGGLIIFSYCCLVSIFPEVILETLYRSKYTGYGYLVILSAVQYVFLFMSRVPQYGIRAVQKARVLFFSSVVTSVISLCISAPLVKYMGLSGACIGMIISQLILLILLFLNFKICQKENNQ